MIREGGRYGWPDYAMSLPVTGEKKHEESKNGKSSGGHTNDDSVSAGPRRLLDVRFAHDRAAL